uniref:Uncharacterized protein n=1 Tax=Amphora coffeiformis TaxID=265554 RepID=A0A7S3LG88_9STRA|mmetsp:Transcript_10575/g.20354  ORF Transcript_10575/g.20354 Transcript_10575/m.20354 type:complete len:428 (+) Transcript_10575:152-1435(+)
MKSSISSPCVAIVLLLAASTVVPSQSFCGSSSSTPTTLSAVQHSSLPSILQQRPRSLSLGQNQNRRRSPQTSSRLCATKDSSNKSGGGEVDLDYLKSQLQEYLAKRKELGGDDLAQAEIGKVVGGTKGNAVLEYISGAPNKPTRIQAAPNALDYDQLTKFGYGHLATPIMKAGGRLAMYELLGLELPDTSASLQPLVVTAPKLVIDREGKTDKARYSGLKLGQILDDDLQAQVLEQAQEKAARGEDLRPKLEEEMYEQPFADKRNVSPPMTPDWTPERLDEWGRQQGKAQAWARRAREGEFVKDPLETIELDTQQTAFSIITALMVSTAFGKSTPNFLQMTGWIPDQTAVPSLLGTLQGPAAGLLLASVGSLVFCATTAKSKNRDAFVWATKGLLGGPLTIKSLRESSALLTQAQDVERKKQSRESS